MVVLCIAWLLPTFGLFITSFRPENDINTSGWWEAFANPLSATTWTLDNYKGDWSGGQTPVNISFVNSLAVAIPATILPIMIAAFAAASMFAYGTALIADEVDDKTITYLFVRPLARRELQGCLQCGARVKARSCSARKPWLLHRHRVRHRAVAT